jgi:hypothetical protein
MTDTPPTGTVNRPVGDSFRAIEHIGKDPSTSEYHKKVYVFPSTTANSHVYFPYIIDVVEHGHKIRADLKP